jgi:hypothetical protein
MVDIKRNLGGINMELMRSPPKDAPKPPDRRRSLSKDTRGTLDRRMSHGPRHAGWTPRAPPVSRRCRASGPGRRCRRAYGSKNYTVTPLDRGAATVAPTDRGATAAESGSNRRLCVPRLPPCLASLSCASRMPPPLALGEPLPRARLGGRHRSCIEVVRQNWILMVCGSFYIHPVLARLNRMSPCLNDLVVRAQNLVYLTWY